MKITKAVIYLTVLLLIISTLATLKLEAASDGFDQYGLLFTIVFLESAMIAIGILVLNRSICFWIFHPPLFVPI
ncbi:hypothetical protein ASU31_05240 [Pedobacter ginsenosidimutans]|uniref:Uncharacterized protein n=1 Tax=Pedobacter ginsenosidimutans TaxID=687842 RepID=A0A0T5VTD5_9SPHI|nr:hypothetical protein [Pedobacter ginsenosidimutans]KRT17080.1 hypothetical protein ASU31_05240 [Pedobacter ginsenosidimutans]